MLKGFCLNLDGMNVNFDNTEKECVTVCMINQTRENEPLWLLPLMMANTHWCTSTGRVHILDQNVSDVGLPRFFHLREGTPPLMGWGGWLGGQHLL